MNAQLIIEFLSLAEKLKCNTRHSWTSSGRHESVAEHSWRLTLLALLMEEDFPDVNMEKVLKMCLIHDLGEAITGDVPAFLKGETDEKREDEAIDGLLATLDDNLSKEWGMLFSEMRELSTKEARLFKALDKIEAVIQHNEADISSWLPLEYELQLTYGLSECAEFEALAKLRVLVNEIAQTKIDDAKKE